MKQLIPLLGLALVAGMAQQASAQYDDSSKLLGQSYPEVPNLAAHAARDYRAKARYPDWSEPIPAGAHDPLQLKREPTEQSLPSGDDWSLSIRASEISFERGQTALFFASVHTRSDYDEDYPLLPLLGPAPKDWSISGVIATVEEGNEYGRIAFRDDGAAPDQKAGDGVYTASYVLPAEFEPEIGSAQNLGVFVTARTDVGDEMKALGGFLYSHPAGHLTGRYRDAVVEGNLVIQAEVEVLASGRFHLAGTLDSSKGQAMVSARMATQLEPGIHWLDLSFYGLALSERDAAGPYTLGSVTLTTATGIPNAFGPLMENVHKTAAYPASRFHTREFGNANLLETARRLELDAARHSSAR